MDPDLTAPLLRSEDLKRSYKALGLHLVSDEQINSSDHEAVVQNLSENIKKLSDMNNSLMGRSFPMREVYKIHKVAASLQMDMIPFDVHTLRSLGLFKQLKLTIDGR